MLPHPLVGWLLSEKEKEPKDEEVVLIEGLAEK